MSAKTTGSTAAARSDGQRQPRSAAKVEHFTTAERVARGKAARAEVPRGAHGEWEPPPQRADPIALLEEQASRGYLGTNRVFDNALAEFAELYATQNERDYDALEQAVASGRLSTETGL